MKIISLTGFMGCGKSSVGRRLSELLCCPFMDLDSVIEERTGRSIPEIFASDGEAAFRQMELETLQNILEEVGKQIILSLGGGTVMTAECAELVREKTLCIYLRASVDTLVSRLASEAEGRPLLSPAPHTEAADSNNSLHPAPDPEDIDSNSLNPAPDPEASNCSNSPNPAPDPEDIDSNSPNEVAAGLRSRIESLVSRRASTYEATAHITIDTDSLSVDDIAQALAMKVKTIR